MANSEKVCAGFAELSPAHGRAKGESVAPAALILPLRWQRPICAPGATATGSGGVSAGLFPPAALRCCHSRGDEWRCPA